MRRNGNGFVYSATALVGYLECNHLSHLDRAVAAGHIRAPTFVEPMLERIARGGELHEQRFRKWLEDRGLTVTEIEGDDALPYRERIVRGRDATLQAMRNETDVVYQAALSDGRRLGYADFLRRVDALSGLGDRNYEVWDTKLARHTKAAAFLQLCM